MYAFLTLKRQGGERMRIRDDVAAINLQSNAYDLDNNIRENLKKIASGLKINSAADDASGLKIAEKMRSQIRGLEQASKNIQDGISLIQTAEAGYNNINELLHRMNELSIKAGNGTLTDSDREKIYVEFSSCIDEIDRIAETTTFNGKKLLSSSSGAIEYESMKRTVGTARVRAAEIGRINLDSIVDNNVLIIKDNDVEYRFEFDVDRVKKEAGSILVDLRNVKTDEEKIQKIKDEIMGNTNLRVIIAGSDEKEKLIQVTAADKVEGETISISTRNYAEVLKTGVEQEDEIFMKYKAMDTLSLGIRNLKLDTDDEIDNSIKCIRDALIQVTKQQVEMGVLQNRLEYSLNRVEIEQLNVEQAKSRITDTDMAEEVVDLTKNKILKEAVSVMMVQVNKDNEKVLELLK